MVSDVLNTDRQESGSIDSFQIQPGGLPVLKHLHVCINSTIIIVPHNMFLRVNARLQYKFMARLLLSHACMQCKYNDVY